MHRRLVRVLIRLRWVLAVAAALLLTGVGVSVWVCAGVTWNYCRGLAVALDVSTSSLQASWWWPKQYPNAGPREWNRWDTWWASGKGIGELIPRPQWALDANPARYWETSEVRIPHHFSAALLVSTAVCGFVLHRRRIVPGQCARCRHKLHGLTVCPECGSPCATTK
jgi:hypothetical protein